MEFYGYLELEHHGEISPRGMDHGAHVSIDLIDRMKKHFSFFHDLTSFEEYLTEEHQKKENVHTIFHLGTTLNVVLPEDAANILKMVAQNMQPGDVLSMLLVDYSQFKDAKKLKMEDSNQNGFGIFINTTSGIHYKTTICDLNLFLQFMKI